MINNTYTELAWSRTKELLAIDSPTGYTDKCAEWVQQAFTEMGFDARMTNKGGVLIDLGGQDNGDNLMLQGHIDTLGCMVTQITGNGCLKMAKLGGMYPHNAEGENVLVYTRDGKTIEGTCQLHNPSVHVNTNYGDTKRSWDTAEIVLDEDVKSAEDTRALGIEVGDFVCFDPRTRRTASGYLKSRFLDDKLCVGILMAFAQYLADNKITLPRRTWLHITIYEEVGHGGSATVPAGVTEIIALDMGCVGDGLMGSEKKVSICAKDTSSPYCYKVVTKLVNAAKATGADYAIDVYPQYGSDVEATLRGGADIRHGLIGPGVFASHGYERSHMDGVENTLKVICGYLNV